MKRTYQFLLLLCLAGWMGIAGSIYEAYAGEVVVIANKDAPADQLDGNAIKQVFLGNTINWSNNDVIMVVLSKDEEAHKAFLEKYIKRTASQFQNVWRQNLFTGKGAMSTSVQGNGEVVDFVSKTKGAIGYVSAGTGLPETVKKLDQ